MCTGIGVAFCDRLTEGLHQRQVRREHFRGLAFVIGRKPDNDWINRSATQKRGETRHQGCAQAVLKHLFQLPVRNRTHTLEISGYLVRGNTLRVFQRHEDTDHPAPVRVPQIPVRFNGVIRRTVSGQKPLDLGAHAGHRGSKPVALVIINFGNVEQPADDRIRSTLSVHTRFWPTQCSGVEVARQPLRLLHRHRHGIGLCRFVRDHPGKWAGYPCQQHADGRDPEGCASVERIHAFSRGASLASIMRRIPACHQAAITPTTRLSSASPFPASRKRSTP